MGVEDDFVAAYAAGDWTASVALIDRHWTTLVFGDRTGPLVFQAMGSVPERALAGAPCAALMAEALGRLPRGSVPVPLAPEPHQVDRAMRSGTARGLLEVAISAMISRRATGLPLEAARIARSSRPLLRAATLTRFSVGADLAAYWHLQAGQAALHAGDLAQAQLDFEHAWTFRDVDVTGYVAPSAAPFLALLTTVAGHDAAAALWHGEVDGCAASGQDLIEWETMERPRLVARLLDASDRIDIAAGRELADLLAAQLAFDELWPVTLFAVVRHLVVADEADRAERLVDATVDLHTTAPATGTMHAAFVALARAEVALARGRSSSVRRLLGGADAHQLPGPSAIYLVRLEIAAGDLATARRLAAVAEHQPGDERTRREARLLGAAIDLATDAAGPAGPWQPALRRTAALLPAALHDGLRSAYGDVVPAPLGDPGPPAVKLTPSEERVLSGLRGSDSLPVVAERLFISRNTLKTHLRGLYSKLGVTSREEAVAVAGRLGLMGDDRPG